MPYQLPPEIDQRVQAQIALGIYQTPAEVLNEALDALDERTKDLSPAQRGIIEDKSANGTKPSSSVDLSARGISEQQAANLRERLTTFACDWDRPEMDVYDDV